MLTRGGRPDKATGSTRRWFGAVPLAPPASLIGTLLEDRYRLDRLVGEGASAWVFAAHDVRLQRSVALKLLKPYKAGERASHRKRFVAEGRVLASLVHPNIVPVHDAGETCEGLGYLVMELAEVGTLEGELCRRQRLTPAETLRLLLPVLGALACAHDRGVVHRDIKPANIVLVAERDELRAKLLDFGIAKRRDATGSDAALGTPSYMAPEQARGAPSSPAIDVWAVGVLFFQCLSGRLPFEAEGSLATVLKAARERAPRFADACRGLGRHLAIALDRALERDQERRYPDTRSFAYALASACALDGLIISARPDPLGLPAFETFLAQADREVTGRSPCSHDEVGILPAYGRATSAYGRSWRSILAAAAASATLALMLAGWSYRHSARLVRDADRPQAAERERRSADVSPSPPAVARSPALVPSIPPPQAEAAIAAPKEIKRLGTSPRKKARAEAVPSEAREHAQNEPSTPPSAKVGVIKDWEW
jgi:serine/threonine protein kinase